ncbi:MAG: FKBP-type peptidyl-prolyl cis-trans isomerase [Saprospiraceae bacterium]
MRTLKIWKPNSNTADISNFKFDYCFILIAACFFIFGSCSDDSSDLTEAQQIEMYIQEIALPFEKTPSGLRYHLINDGIGDLPQPDDNMEIFIRGFSLENTIFLNNFGASPLAIDPFTDNNSPQGLIEGLKLMKNKSQFIFIMPSSIGYGATGNGTGTITPGSPVVFGVEMGCLENPEETINLNISGIEKYLFDNNLVAEKTESGLYYLIEKEGDGEHPSPTSFVEVNYRGYLLNGTEFDTNLDSNVPARFSLDAVILGWTEGIPLFSRGAKGKLLIPNTLAYGCYPPNPIIPPLEVLIFDIELLDF